MNMLKLPIIVTRTLEFFFLNLKLKSILYYYIQHRN